MSQPDNSGLKLNVLLASHAETGLVIRQGVGKSVCTFRWDLRKDVFDLGQWMGGRIDLGTCDISPDGAHFLYTARKYVSRVMRTKVWTAVSRVPYLKAVAYYPRRSAGGWFIDSRSYCVVGGSPHSEDLESVRLRRVEKPLPETSLHMARQLRGGWALSDIWSRMAGSEGLSRLAGQGWELHHHLGVGYRLVRGMQAIDTSKWTWADVRRKRLLWAVDGCLWAGKLSKDGIEEAKLLKEFKGMRFEAIEAPYEGGKPVQTKALTSEPVDAVPKQIERALVRKKPDRSKAQWKNELDDSF